MNTANNQLHKETEKRLRKALLFYMNEEKEPTVGQLCAHAGINRSTFYRHYVDVFDLMEKTEKEIQQGLFESLRGDESFLARIASSPEALLPLITYIGENRHFYRMYMRKYGGVPLADQFTRFWERRIVPYFRTRGIENEAHMRYYFEYVKAGFMMVIGCWLDGGCQEPPEELAEILYKMMPSEG